jgi:NAD(P)-dependent dehydrogenase (short-subunit alcohol dehydrogenase family)
MGSLDGRVAVVTGAGRGIGFEYAKALAEDGATVVVADVDAAMARTASSELAASGTVVDAQVDVSDQASTRRLAEEVGERFGAAHILVNNAAIYHSMRRDSILEVDIEYWRRFMAVNVDGAVLMTQAFAPLMIEAGWGRVVNQASTAAYSGGVGGHYAVSKLATVGVTQALARELGPHGITVNAIAPGLIFTEATMVTVSEDAQNALVAQQCIKRKGSPEDLVGALRYFCSDAASWTSGQVLIVDGYKTIRI